LVRVAGKKLQLFTHSTLPLTDKETPLLVTSSQAQDKKAVTEGNTLSESDGDCQPTDEGKQVMSQ
jgi:hypothetical protein